MVQLLLARVGEWVGLHARVSIARSNENAAAEQDAAGIDDDEDDVTRIERRRRLRWPAASGLKIDPPPLPLGQVLLVPREPVQPPCGRWVGTRARISRS